MVGDLVALWIQIGEALSLAESDLDQDRGAILVRHGKGGHRRELGMDRWGAESTRPFTAATPR